MPEIKIRYYGHAGQPSGYGRAAEDTCMALLAMGCDLEIRTLAPYDKLAFRPGLPLASLLRKDSQLSPAPDVVIIHTLPFDCARVLDLVRGSVTGRPLWIAYTTWEATECPDAFGYQYAPFDAVWQPSQTAGQAVARALRRVLPTPPLLSTVPHAYDPPNHHAPRHASEFVDRLSGGAAYRFYYIGTLDQRKNVDGLIRAYANAFTNEDDVELVIQSAGADLGDLGGSYAEIAATASPQSLPYLRFNGTRLTDYEVHCLHAYSECYVTASRGEAWNLPCFDAMITRRHIIAPRHQGTDDYLGAAQTSATLVDVGYREWAGAASKLLWWEPDLAAIGAAMRAAYQDGLGVLTVNYAPAARYSHAAVGVRIKTILDTLTKET